MHRGWRWMVTKFHCNWKTAIWEPENLTVWSSSVETKTFFLKQKLLIYSCDVNPESRRERQTGLCIPGLSTDRWNFTKHLRNPLTLSFCFIIFFLFSYLFAYFPVCRLYFTLSFLHTLLLCLSLQSFFCLLFLFPSSVFCLFNIYSSLLFLPLIFPCFFLPSFYSFLCVCFCPISLLPTFIFSFLAPKLSVSIVLCNVILMLLTLLITSNSHFSLHTYLS
jgi:hypothetical protein